jgi:DNA-directed RNA polymerase specialized sigma24 family protein
MQKYAGEGPLDLRTYRLLEEQDWASIGRKLLRFAVSRARIYGWTGGPDMELAAGCTPEDLVQSVITKTIEGTRRWDPDKGPLEPWLKDQVKSVLDALYRSAPSTHEVPIPEDDEGEELIDQLEHHAIETEGPGTSLSGSVEQGILKREEDHLRRQLISQRVDAIFEVASGDSTMEAIIDAIMNGCEPQPRFVAAELDMRVDDINNARKRFRRRLAGSTEGESS